MTRKFDLGVEVNTDREVEVGVDQEVVVIIERGSMILIVDILIRDIIIIRVDLDTKTNAVQMIGIEIVTVVTTVTEIVISVLAE